MIYKIHTDFKMKRGEFRCCVCLLDKSRFSFFMNHQMCSPHRTIKTHQAPQINQPCSLPTMFVIQHVRHEQHRATTDQQRTTPKRYLTVEESLDVSERSLVVYLSDSTTLHDTAILPHHTSSCAPAKKILCRYSNIHSVNPDQQ